MKLNVFYSLHHLNGFEKRTPELSAMLFITSYLFSNRRVDKMA